jgi:G6PDH family F420-dependent oxidoreductase
LDSAPVKLAASHGDALIAVQPDGGLIAEFDAAAGAGKPKYGQLPVCYDRDEQAARARARELWRWAVPGWHVMAELPDPRAFDAASGAVREEDVTALVPCGPDVGSYVKAAREWIAAGFTHLALVQVGAGSQHDFIAWAAAELLPALREL